MIFKSRQNRTDFHSYGWAADPCDTPDDNLMLVQGRSLRPDLTNIRDELH